MGTHISIYLSEPRPRVKPAYLRGRVFTQARHYGFARSPSAAFPSTLLLPARCRRADPGLAVDGNYARRRPERSHNRPVHWPFAI